MLFNLTYYPFQIPIFFPFVCDLLFYCVKDIMLFLLSNRIWLLQQISAECHFFSLSRFAPSHTQLPMFTQVNQSINQSKSIINEILWQLNICIFHLYFQYVEGIHILRVFSLLHLHSVLSSKSNNNLII